MWDSCFTQFKLDYRETKHVHVGDAVTSGDIAAGGHLWRINCYPRGYSHHTMARYVSLFLERRSQRSPGGVKAIFDAFVLDTTGKPAYARRTMKVFSPDERHGWADFVKRRVLEDLFFVTEDGCVTIVCGIIVAGGGAGVAIPVPPSDMGAHIAGLLTDGAVGADVSFSVGGEAFPAHRAVLAARSPVFRAELFGPMSEATSPSITLQDISPATFRFMLRFIYTDALPGDAEFGDAPTEPMRELLAAADRFALDRMKLMCAQKLWEKLTVGTFASTLAFAETYSCPELKSKCIDFFAVEKNLKKVIFTDGFVWLMQKCPWLVAELKQRVGM